MRKNEIQILKDMESEAFKDYKLVLECYGEDNINTQKALSKWIGLFDVLRKFNIE